MPGKPHPDYPLTAHVRGRWMFRFTDRTTGKRKYFYFGTHDDPDAALDSMIVYAADNGWDLRTLLKENQARYVCKHLAERYDAWKDAVEYADPWEPIEEMIDGLREDGPSGDPLSVAHICDAFMERQKERHAAGKLAWSTYEEHNLVCRMVRDRFIGRRVDELTPSDFATWADELTTTYAPKTARKRISNITTVFRWAHKSIRYESGGRTVPVPLPDYGPDWIAPSAAEIRTERSLRRMRGEVRCFTAEEVRLFLDRLDLMYAPTRTQWRAMILTAVNCALYAVDVASLTLELVDLEERALIDLRAKTGAIRAAYLWPETVDAIRDYLPERPKPQKGCEELLFLNTGGNQWTRRGQGDDPYFDGTGRQFGRYLKSLEKANLYKTRSGLNFGAMRHTAATAADPFPDMRAKRLLMGHIDPTITEDQYVEMIEQGRIRELSEYLRNWLFSSNST